MSDRSDVKAVVRLWWKHLDDEDETEFRAALSDNGLMWPEEAIAVMADGLDGAPAERVIVALGLIESTGCCTRGGLQQIRDAILGESS
jgi:hypothetical protein